MTKTLEMFPIVNAVCININSEFLSFFLNSKFYMSPKYSHSDLDTVKGLNLGVTVDCVV